MSTDSRVSIKETFKSASDFLTFDEAAELLRVKKSTIYNYINKGMLTRRGPGKRTFFLRSEIEGILQHPKD